MIYILGQTIQHDFEDESTWTIEDQKLIRIQLVKAHHKTKDLCWKSLLESQYEPDPYTFNEMRKKLDLENFQKVAQI